jgi:hypothetical protein
MTRLLRDVRVIPIVLIAISALFVLKATGLILNGSYTLSAEDDITGSVTQRPGVGAALPEQSAPAEPRQRSWAQQMFNFPDITGAVKEATPKAESAERQGQGQAKANRARTAADARWPRSRSMVAVVARRTCGAGTVGRAAR